MKISEKRLLAEILNALARTGKIPVSNSKTAELFSGEDIRIVCMKGDVIHICLSEPISVKREKNKS